MGGGQKRERRGKVEDCAPPPAWPHQLSSTQPLPPPSPVLPQPRGWGEEKEREERHGSGWRRVFFSSVTQPALAPAKRPLIYFPW